MVDPQHPTKITIQYPDLGLSTKQGEVPPLGQGGQAPNVAMPAGYQPPSATPQPGMGGAPPADERGALREDAVRYLKDQLSALQQRKAAESEVTPAPSGQPNTKQLGTIAALGIIAVALGDKRGEFLSHALPALQQATAARQGAEYQTKESARQGRITAAQTSGDIAQLNATSVLQKIAVLDRMEMDANTRKEKVGKLIADSMNKEFKTLEDVIAAREGALFQARFFDPKFTFAPEVIRGFELLEESVKSRMTDEAKKKAEADKQKRISDAIGTLRGDASRLVTAMAAAMQLANPESQRAALRAELDKFDQRKKDLVDAGADPAALPQTPALLLGKSRSAQTAEQARADRLADRAYQRQRDKAMDKRWQMEWGMKVKEFDLKTKKGKQEAVGKLDQAVNEARDRRIMLTDTEPPKPEVAEDGTVDKAQNDARKAWEEESQKAWEEEYLAYASKQRALGNQVPSYSTYLMKQTGINAFDPMGLTGPLGLQPENNPRIMGGTIGGGVKKNPQRKAAPKAAPKTSGKFHYELQNGKMVKVPG